jgi:hypothetical protein
MNRRDNVGFGPALVGGIALPRPLLLGTPAGAHDPAYLSVASSFQTTSAGSRRGPTRDSFRTTHVGPNQTGIESEEWLKSDVAADSWRKTVPRCERTPSRAVSDV